MKVTTKSLTSEAMEARDYRDILHILIDDKVVFDVYDGEPEDANLGRDFSACWGIPDIIERAFKAGQSGETLTMESLEVGIDDI